VDLFHRDHCLAEVIYAFENPKARPSVKEHFLLLLVHRVVANEPAGMRDYDELDISRVDDSTGSSARKRWVLDDVPNLMIRDGF
jgi:hypothetical protein